MGKIPHCSNIPFVHTFFGLNLGFLNAHRLHVYRKLRTTFRLSCAIRTGLYRGGLKGKKTLIYLFVRARFVLIYQSAQAKKCQSGVVIND